jgi:hypothetical protein
MVELKIGKKIYEMKFISWDSGAALFASRRCSHRGNNAKKNYWDSTER